MILYPAVRLDGGGTQLLPGGLHGMKANKENTMTLSHVDALNSKHAGLEAQLAAEQARPAPDDTMVKSLKRAKLRIKEELSRF